MTLSTNDQTGAHRRTDGGRLDIENLTKTYVGRKTSVTALRGMNFTVRGGESFVLLGPSGCGKSTLLSLIAGLDSPTSGSVRLNDVVVDSPSDDVGMMFQDPVLLPWKKAIDNVALPAAIRRRKQGRPDMGRARAALEQVGLNGFERSYPWELSGGMQRRVALARILFQDPDVLLMDEPFAALDEFTRFNLNVLLRRLLKERSKTVVLVTHNVEEAVLMADRIAILTPRPGQLQEIVDVAITGQRDESTLSSQVFSETVLQVRRRMAVLHGNASSS